MGKVFGRYSNFYNTIYQDKDYKSEAAYITELISKYRTRETKTILDMGCGTGKHDFCFADSGYDVFGLDLSPAMIDEANRIMGESTNQSAHSGLLEFLQSDIRNFRTERRFDAIVSLFHVASYQRSNKDLQDFFLTAYNHLEKGGLFIFDFWYGPAVISDRPQTKDRVFEDENYVVRRRTIPEMKPNENIAEINFHIEVKDKNTNVEETLHEIHSMRYLFLPEIEYFAESSGFELIRSLEWMSHEKPLSFDSWYGLVVLRKK